MGILSSMYSGISGIRGQGEALAVYGDNIANANTTGFKVARPEFQDVVSGLLRQVPVGAQIGRGTKLSSVNTIFSQGSLVQTENPTDLAIQGDGFFVVHDKEGQYFTRDGAFHFNKEGKLVTQEGHVVRGYAADDQGNITSRLSDISVDRTVVDARKTEQVELQMNLDLRTEINKKFDPKNPDKTSQFATGVTVYDTAGTAHTLSVYFNKTDNGEWTWKAMARGDEVVGGEGKALVEQATGRLLFDQDGRLKEQIVDNSSFNFNKGANPDQKINFYFGPDKKSGGPGTKVTQYGSSSEAYKVVQDGYQAGTLSALAFQDDGTLAGVYSNGQNINLAQVALARFENPEALYKIGRNLYRESRSSGQGTLGSPQSGGRGRVAAKTIESSTTDIANEFINLMNAQHNFQANSRVVKVADDMMQEVLNLKRS